MEVQRELLVLRNGRRLFKDRIDRYVVRGHGKAVRAPDRRQLDAVRCCRCGLSCLQQIQARKRIAALWRGDNDKWFTFFCGCERVLIANSTHIYAAADVVLHDRADGVFAALPAQRCALPHLGTLSLDLRFLFHGLRGFCCFLHCKLRSMLLCKGANGQRAHNEHECHYHGK